jgi:hypothetical protein
MMKSKSNQILDKKESSANLENPVSTAKKACNSKGKYIMCCKWLHNLSVLHNSKLRQHRHCLQIDTESPKYPVDKVM